MDYNRHVADSEERYRKYFELLHSRIRQYNVEAENIHNMDKKGFLVDIIGCSKHVFSKAVWEHKEKTQARQDGSTEWVTVLAAVCADRNALPPALIFQEKKGLQSTWVDDVEAGKHSVFLGNSPPGWSNNELGMACLEQLFDRFTKEKAQRKWQLLILDGHGSHLTMDFISFCNANKFLLMVFLPHSTHSLQPLDVVLFAPLSSAYSADLLRYLHRSQELLSVKKGDFFMLFWGA
jgi:hypothetical protein